MHQSRTTETQGNHDLFEAFAGSGCAICALTRRGVSRYMNSTNYDSVSDPEIRKHFEASQGFCNRHAHQWLREAFVLGTAQIYRDVLLMTTEDLRQQSFRSAPIAQRVGSLFGRQRSEASGEGSLMGPTERCPACVILERTESGLLRTLSKGLADPAFREAYAGSNGLCAPHLRVALAMAPNEAAFACLQERAVRTQVDLIAHLNESIRKHDYRYQHEPAGEEKGSPHRAVAHVAGAEGVAKAGER